MNADQRTIFTNRAAKLGKERYRLGRPNSSEAVSLVEHRLGIVFPISVRSFYEQFDGFSVSAPTLSIFPLDSLIFSHPALLTFCEIDRLHRLAFDTRRLNAPDEWTVVNAANGYPVTLTMGSFLFTRIWTWIEKRRPIWYDVHRAR